MTEVIEPSPQAIRIRTEIMRLVLAENDKTGDTQSVFHGLALAFGMVLSSVQRDPEAAAQWMEREAIRIRLSETKGMMQ